MTQPVTAVRLFEFILKMNELYRHHYIEKNFTFAPPTFSYSIGKKNIKVIMTDVSGSASVYCFIEKDTGNILKAAGWNAPAKGTRGSIWNPDCDVGDDKPCNVHGGNLYAR